jgi:hypothetical protein
MRGESGYASTLVLGRNAPGSRESAPGSPALSPGDRGFRKQYNPAERDEAGRDRDTARPEVSP